MAEKIWNYCVKNNECIQSKFLSNKNDTSKFVDLNVNKIFGSETKKERVLCIGDVQSGKTNTIIGSIKRAYKENYGCVIFLGGTNNCLNSQSYSRFISDLQTWKTNDKKVQVIKDFKNIGNQLIRCLNENDFIVFVVLKGRDKLIDIKKYLLSALSCFKRKTLLIDDESDFGSAFVSNPNGNKIHNLVEEVYSKMDEGKFLSVTATPFANILSCNSNNSITYDRFVRFEKSDAYTGCDFFSKQKDFYISSEWEKKDWEQLIDFSLSLWVISTALYRLNEGIFHKSEFLINVDLLSPTHEKVKIFVLKKLKWMHDYPNNEHWKKVMSEIFSIQSSCKEKVCNLALNVVDDILNHNEKIVVLNGKSKQSKDFYSDKYNNAIVIGGHVVSRGFTFNNLITELFINSPKDIAIADTTLQRCRWFGYRLKNNQYKYMKVVINETNLKTIEYSNELIKKINNVDEFRFDKLLDLVTKYSNISDLKLTGKK